MKKAAGFAALALCVAMVVCGIFAFSGDRADPAPHPAQAYCQVLLSMMETDTALSSDIKYIALDLKECKLEDTAELVRLAEAYCAEHGLTLLLDDYAGLVQKGYVDSEELYWPDGVIITFIDQSLGKKKLVTEGELWRSGTGAFGNRYTLRLKDSWQITNIRYLWVS